MTARRRRRAPSEQITGDKVSRAYSPAAAEVPLHNLAAPPSAAISRTALTAVRGRPAAAQAWRRVRTTSKGCSATATAVPEIAPAAAAVPPIFWLRFYDLFDGSRDLRPDVHSAVIWLCHRRSGRGLQGIRKIGSQRKVCETLDVKQRQRAVVRVKPKRPAHLRLAVLPRVLIR